MSRKFRKRVVRNLGPFKRYELLTGECVYAIRNYSGYGDGQNKDLAAFISDEMREDWRANRDELLEFWATGKCTTNGYFKDEKIYLFTYGLPGTVPWAEEQFGDGSSSDEPPAD